MRSLGRFFLASAWVWFCFFFYNRESLEKLPQKTRCLIFLLLEDVPCLIVRALLDVSCL